MQLDIDAAGCSWIQMQLDRCSWTQMQLDADAAVYRCSWIQMQHRLLFHCYTLYHLQHCHSSHSPVPTITWRKINGNIPKKARLRKSQAVLEIPNIQLEDSGTYECKAENPRGGTAFKGHLQVYSESKYNIIYILFFFICIFQRIKCAFFYCSKWHAYNVTAGRFKHSCSYSPLVFLDPFSFVQPSYIIQQKAYIIVLIYSYSRNISPHNCSTLSF